MGDEFRLSKADSIQAGVKRDANLIFFVLSTELIALLDFDWFRETILNRVYWKLSDKCLRQAISNGKQPADNTKFFIEQ